jgi:hypothetical protein
VERRSSFREVSVSFSYLKLLNGIRSIFEVVQLYQFHIPSRFTINFMIDGTTSLSSERTEMLIKAEMFSCKKLKCFLVNLVQMFHIPNRFTD